MSTKKKTAAAKAKTARKPAPRSEPAAAPDLVEARSWLSLRMLEAFVTVVQEDGMTSAGQRLGMTQSAVSQVVTAMEAGFKAQLIDRATRPMRLTLFGTAVYERAVELLRQARELERLLEVQKNARLPVLRIGMVDSFASTAGPHLLRELAAVAARWSVTSGVQETTVRALAERRLDVIITSEEVERDSDYLVLPIFREPLFIVTPKGMKSGRGTISELAEQLPLVRFSANALIGRQVSAYLQQQQLALGREYEFDSSDAVLAMVKAGLGWTITTPLVVLKTHWVTDDFEFLPLRPAGTPRSLRVVAHRDEHAALWSRIAAAAEAILKDEWAPAVKRLAPWAAASMG